MKTGENKVNFLFGVYIIVTTVITGVLGISVKGLIGETMKTPMLISAGLFTTGTGLIFIERFKKYGNRTVKEMTVRDAVIVGIGQALAVMPGISRSGSTLVAALGVGLNRDTSVRYSFLLVIPVILGSTVLLVGDVSVALWSVIGTGQLLLSFVVCFIFSWIGIVWLINFLKQGRIIYFALYCYIVAFLVFCFINDIPSTV